VKILCLARGYASYGASILTSAGQHLEQYLVSVEPADLTIEVMAYLPHEGPAKRTLEHSLEQHLKRFPDQARATYRAKTGKLNIEYPSSLSEAESFGRPGGIYAVSHLLTKALDELCDAILDGLRIKPAIWKSVDGIQLSSAIEASRKSLPTDAADLLAHMRQMDETRKAAATSPKSVDDLEIDWGQYHPSARMVLNSPLFWSEGDDDSPHGNDTGSDLLAAFKRWNKKNPTSSYSGYVDRLLSRWGLSPEKATGKLDDEQLSWLRQEADIALAFAVLKLRGKCQEGELRTAISAINTRIARLHDHKDRVQKLISLKDILEAHLSAWGTTDRSQSDHI